MHKFKVVLKWFGYVLLFLFALLHIVSAFSGNVSQTSRLVSIGLVFGICLIFAIRWQKKNKKVDDNNVK